MHDLAKSAAEPYLNRSSGSQMGGTSWQKPCNRAHNWSFDRRMSMVIFAIVFLLQASSFWGILGGTFLVIAFSYMLVFWVLMYFSPIL